MSSIVKVILSLKKSVILFLQIYHFNVLQSYSMLYIAKSGQQAKKGFCVKLLGLPRTEDIVV